MENDEIIMNEAINEEIAPTMSTEIVPVAEVEKSGKADYVKKGLIIAGIIGGVYVTKKWIFPWARKKIKGMMKESIFEGATEEPKEIEVESTEKEPVKEETK